MVWREHSQGALVGKGITVYSWAHGQWLLLSLADHTPGPPDCLCIVIRILSQSLSSQDSALNYSSSSGTALHCAHADSTSILHSSSRITPHTPVCLYTARLSCYQEIVRLFYAVSKPRMFSPSVWEVSSGGSQQCKALSLPWLLESQTVYTPCG